MQPQNAGLKETGAFAPLAGDITLRCDKINQKYIKKYIDFLAVFRGEAGQRN